MKKHGTVRPAMLPVSLSSRLKKKDSARADFSANMFKVRITWPLFAGSFPMTGGEEPTMKLKKRISLSVVLGSFLIWGSLANSWAGERAYRVVKKEKHHHAGRG
jgi:hypothetical protein